MKILGIDPGSIITGYGIVESLPGGRLGHVASGQIKTTAKAEMPKRLLEIMTGLNAVIEDHRPEAVAVESVFFAKNAKSALVLGQARGVAIVAAASFGLKVFEYPPKTIKQAVTGYGSATKEQVQEMVKALLKLKVKPKADAADALAASICHLHHDAVMQKVSTA